MATVARDLIPGLGTPYAVGAKKKKKGKKKKKKINGHPSSFCLTLLKNDGTECQIHVLPECCDTSKGK